MRRIIITESERKNILRSHGVILEELSPAEMLAAIQGAVGTTVDKKIGQDTTQKLVSALQGVVSTNIGFDWTCVKKNKNKKPITVFDETKEETVFKGYQIGDLVFEKSGNYYKVGDESNKKTYTCDGIEIKLTDGTIITGEVKKDNSGFIKRFIDDFEEEGTPKSEIARILLNRKYSKEEIIKANPSYASVFNSLSEIPNKQNVNRETKSNPDKTIQDTEDEAVADEDTLFTVRNK